MQIIKKIIIFLYPSLKRDSNLWNQNFLPALPIKTKTWSIWFCKQIIFQNYQTRKIFANLDLKTKKSANFLISNFGSFPVREIAPPPQWPPRPVNAKKIKFECFSPFGRATSHLEVYQLKVTKSRNSKSDEILQAGTDATFIRTTLIRPLTFKLGYKKLRTKSLT